MVYENGGDSTAISTATSTGTANHVNTNAVRKPMVMDSITQQIGNTPLVRLNKVPQSLGIEANVYAKLEFFNAGGSIKDRIALRMIEEAEKEGRIKPGDTLIEPTSGNTYGVMAPFILKGIGLALVGAVKGYRTIITLPEKMSNEKVAVLRALNAEIVRTPTQAAFDSPESHIGVAKRLQKEIPNAHILDQYGNPNNPLAHEYGTAEEIWQQTNGQVAAVVAGAGTGGTVTGIARGLRKHNPEIKIIAADPQGSVLALPESLNEEYANTPYKVEGIGYDFIPDVLDRQKVNKWYKTNDREAFMYARRLIAEEGLLVGGSSGSAFAAMIHAAKDLQLSKTDNIVVVLPDSIRSYLSKFADDDWLAANDLLPPTPPKTPHLTGVANSNDPYEGATIRSLRLKPVSTISAAAPCAEAIEIMRDKSFDQLPVCSVSGSRLVGLVTLGNLLSLISSGRATATSTVQDVMFDFQPLDKIVSDPTELISELSISEERPASTDDTTGETIPATPSKSKGWRLPSKRHAFVEITMDTPISALSRFFEKNSAAVVTERREAGGMKAVAVVTKVDLLSWLVQAGSKTAKGR